MVVTLKVSLDRERRGEYDDTGLSVFRSTESAWGHSRAHWRYSQNNVFVSLYILFRPHTEYKIKFTCRPPKLWTFRKQYNPSSTATWVDTLDHGWKTRIAGEYHVRRRRRRTKSREGRILRLRLSRDKNGRLGDIETGRPGRDNRGLARHKTQTTTDRILWLNEWSCDYRKSCDSAEPTMDSIEITYWRCWFGGQMTAVIGSHGVKATILCLCQFRLCHSVCVTYPLLSSYQLVKYFYCFYSGVKLFCCITVSCCGMLCWVLATDHTIQTYCDNVIRLTMLSRLQLWTQQGEHHESLVLLSQGSASDGKTLHVDELSVTCLTFHPGTFSCLMS